MEPSFDEGGLSPGRSYPTSLLLPEHEGRRDKDGGEMPSPSSPIMDEELSSKSSSGPKAPKTVRIMDSMKKQTIKSNKSSKIKVTARRQSVWAKAKF